MKKSVTLYGIAFTMLYFFSIIVFNNQAMAGSDVSVQGNGEVKYLKITAYFSGFSYHIGQNFYIKAVNASTGQDVHNSMREMVVTQSDFWLVIDSIPLAKEYWGMGFSYNLDFYADLNKNGKYDAPPIDHAWRVTISNMKKDTTLNFSHNLNFTDIKWTNSISKVGDDMMSSGITLQQNYPNPFSLTTTISFSITGSQNTTLDIYDEYGNNVKNVVNQNLSDGQYSYNVDALGLSAGVYYYRLKTGISDDVKKMIIVK